MTRVLIAVRHALLRAGLAQLFRDASDLDIDGDCRTASQIIRWMTQTAGESRLILIGNDLGPSAVAEILDAARSVDVPPRLLLLDEFRDSSAQLLIDAIRSGAGEPPAPAPSARFTGRDRLVLRAVVEGLTNKEIAQRIAVSESAVKASLQRLFEKIGVRSRSRLVRVALEKFPGELREPGG